MEHVDTDKHGALKSSRFLDEVGSLTEFRVDLLSNVGSHSERLLVFEVGVKCHALTGDT